MANLKDLENAVARCWRIHRLYERAVGRGDEAEANMRFGMLMDAEEITGNLAVQLRQTVTLPLRGNVTNA